MADFAPNTLYYGDNLHVLRDFPPECVDLVYLDPPFNSNRSYNVLFKESKGADSEAQIEAFGDTWSWGLHAEETYNDVVARGDDVGRLLQAFVQALGRNDVTAYLTMMAPRLVELRRVMKPTASIYLHCDPTASHYLKVLMDAVFGPRNFRSEIIWQRYGSHNDARRNFAAIHDTILAYGRSTVVTFNPQHTAHDQEYLDRSYRHYDTSGRRYRVQNLASPNPRPNLTYEYTALNGVTYHPHRNGWKVTRERMRQMDEEGRLVYPSKPGGRLAVKNYLDEMAGPPLSDVWTDVKPLTGSHAERIGYPTQKPEALLERIIAAASNEGDIVLDPFCGCGTATVAAQRLGRRWIGIDITYLAVDLMRRRLLDAFPDDFPDGIPVDGDPADEAAALALAERDKYQFQYWAVARLGGTARGGENRKGMDRGIDGVTTFPELDPDQAGATVQYRQVVISVKGGATGPKDVRDLRGTVDREGAAIGVLVTARPPTDEMVKEAATGGLYTSTWDGRTFPRLQILTAADVVHGKRIEMPSQRGTSDFARAPRARRGRQPKLDL